MYSKSIRALGWAFFLGIASTVSAIGFNESQLNGVNDVTGLGGAVVVAVSPDGNVVHAAGFSDKSIATFSRQSTGKLTFVESYTNATNLNGINNLIISADGKFVYAATLFGNGIAIFNRDANGHLTFIQVFTAAGLTQVNNLSLSFDNKFLYTTSTTDGVGVFSRNSSTGLLTAVDTKSLSGAVCLTNSPDNKYLYVCAGDAVSFFSRDIATGRLTLMGDYRNGINELIGLGGAYDVVVSPDNLRVYVAANSDNAVTVFKRNADGSLSFLSSYNGDTINGLFGVRALAISSDNKKLYAAGSSQHTLVEFDVNSTGLAYRSQLKDGVAGVNGIAGISDVAVSPDNQNIYATGLSSNGLGVFNAKMVDLSIAQTLPAEGLINTAFSAQITIKNSTLDSATNVILTDTLPSGVTINSAVPSQGTCSPSGNTLNCALGNLAASATATVNVTLTPTAAGILNHNPRVSSTEPDSNAANNQNTTSINILSKILQADVGVTLTPSADLLNSNSDLVYSIAIKNNGADDATLTALNVQLPDLAVFSRVETSQGTCANASQTVTCDLGLLTQNATANVTLYLITPTAIADLITTATVSASPKDPVLTNNSATSTVKVQPVYTDLTVSKFDAQTTAISLGQSAVLTATFANLSTTANTSNVTLGITFSPSDGARFLGATTSVQVLDPQHPCVEIAAGQLKCAMGTFDANNPPQTLQLSLYPLKSGTLNVAATISANATDTDSANNSQNINLNVTGDAVDLSVAQTASPNPPSLDNPLAFNILLTNNHDSQKATNVRLTDTLPLGVDFIGVLPSQGTCSENAGIINCLLGEIQAKSTATINLSLRPRNLGNLQHSVQISSDTFDPVSSNNSQTLLLNVSEPKIDLESLLTVDKTSILPGDEVIYQLKVSNKGAAQADTVLARFQIPSILAISSVSTEQGSCSTNLQEINCSLGTVFSGKTVTMTVRTIAQQAGSGDVTVEAAGLQQDTNAANNKTSLKTTVNLPPALFYVATWQTPNLLGATALTLSSDYKNLYVAAFNANQVTAFSRDADGKLQELQVITHQNLQRPISIATTGDGNWVIVAAYANNSLEVFRRNPTTGELVWQQSLKAPDVLSGPLSLTTFGQTVYVAGLATKNIVGFQIDSNGTITGLSSFAQNVNGVTGLDGVSAMAISQDGSRLYLTSLNDNALTVFNRSSGGQLTFVQSYKNTLNGAAGVAISPDHAHIYVASGTDQAIYALKRETNGTLTPLASYPSAQLDGIAQLTISPDGLWVYAAASNVSTLNIFSRDPITGLLKSSTPLVNAQNGVSGLAGVRALTVGNDGNVYTASLVDGAVAMFRPPQANLKLSIQTDTPNPVSGQSFAYLLTIQNVGPDPSSDLQLTAQLPATVTLQNITTTQGAVCQPNSISCHLAGLDVGKSATVRVTVLPSAQGTVQFSASVSGQQIDPQPADNTATLNTPILGRADLQLSLQPDFEAIPLGNSITYKMTLTNAGPDFADNIKLNITLPTAVRFKTATLGDSLCGYQNGLVSCSVSRLENQADISGSVIIEPLQVGILQAQAVVSATQVDPTSPNQITSLVDVTNNIINNAYDNTNKTLSGVRISASGSVIGGVLAGKIDSNGLISKVQIAENALVSGGSLDGTIQSLGIIENVQLNAGAQLSGGIIRGNITGSGGSLQNIHIAANAQLSGILIGAGGVVFDGAITFGANVQFVNNTQIPANTDLTAIFATIPATGLNIQALNLSTDVVKFGTPLLSQINAIPLLSSNRMAFTQLNNGAMVLSMGDGNYIYLLPLQISQTLAPTNLIINDNNSVQFITAQGRNIIAQPVLAINLSSALNLSLFMQPNGNVYLPQPNNSTAIFRPTMTIIQPNIMDYFTHPVELTAIAAQLKNLTNFSMIFDDILGQRRQQILYNTVYSFNAWKTWAQKYGFEAIFSPDGVISIKVGNETHKGVFDYFITKGTPPVNAELTLSQTADKNQDGINDFLITYPDGYQQILYFWF